jgi:hypothetical protein
MDGILAALINITALNWLLEIKPGFLLSDLTLAVLLGFTSMILNHAIMSILKWNVWIMPRPWHWNAGGYWHMVSMTIQMSFLFFPLIILFNNPPLWQESITQFTLSSITFLTALFGLALYFSSRKKDLKIGPLHISNKPW